MHPAGLCGSYGAFRYNNSAGQFSLWLIHRLPCPGSNVFAYYWDSLPWPIRVERAGIVLLALLHCKCSLYTALAHNYCFYGGTELVCDKVSETFCCVFTIPFLILFWFSQDINLLYVRFFLKFLLVPHYRILFSGHNLRGLQSCKAVNQIQAIDPSDSRTLTKRLPLLVINVQYKQDVQSCYTKPTVKIKNE